MKWEAELNIHHKRYTYVDLVKIAEEFDSPLDKLPYSIRILIESVARHLDDELTLDYLIPLVQWQANNPKGIVPFKPERIVLQDFTGVPAVADLAAMRDAIVALEGDANAINPEIPVTLVVDHSVQVDKAGTAEAIAFNTEKEFERNHERYQFLKWAQQSFENFEVVPPETGIIHQVNIESLSDVVMKKELADRTWVFPDTLQGTDSHTTMINGLGVLGWGVGGIEAEAAILGEASFFPAPEVIGVEFYGQMPPESTATDLALAVTQRLRKENVVGKFVEYFGAGYSSLSLADRATLANMAPEYGATCGFCPIDEETIRYLRLTGRSEQLVELVESYAKANHLFYDPDKTPTYSAVISINLAEIHPALAGPKRPQDRILLENTADDFTASLTAPVGPKGFGLSFEEAAKTAEVLWEDGQSNTLATGDIVLAAITSCTNTSNPYVMICAGLLAKKAIEKGLKVPNYVKTSLAPGSQIVTSYLEKSGLMPYLEKLGFYLVGYGCTTCIGNSGPLAKPVAVAIEAEQLLVASVLSGNRNFEGRNHPLIKANYLASPPLVIAYALAGSIRKNLVKEPIARANDQDIYLKDLWPEASEINQYIQKYVDPQAFKDAYAHLFDANARWNAIETAASSCYPWEEQSTYIAQPPFFKALTKELPQMPNLQNLKVLAKLGDSVTTDHISPAGNISMSSPAGKYLQQKNVSYREFNSYGSRRGNHHIMIRGTFGNIRLQNQLVPEVAGGVTKNWLTGKTETIFDTATAYQAADIGSIVLAGKDYGMGSSRDWAAKGAQLLGVKVVLAESFERIHRSNLVMMGILPLEYIDDQSAEKLGLTGEESFHIHLPKTPQVQQKINVTVVKPDEQQLTFQTKLRFDSPADLRYWQHQGILPMVIRKKIAERKKEQK